MDFHCTCGQTFQGPPGYIGDLCKCPFCGNVVNCKDPHPHPEGFFDNTEGARFPCPSCGAENSVVVEICHQCGYQLKEYEKTDWKDCLLLSKEATITLVLGLILALAVSFGDLKFARFIIHHFITLVHEFGHAFCSWLFGYFAVPAFDFTHGGGVTITDTSLNVSVRIGVYVVLAWCMWMFRRYKLILSGFGVIVGSLALCQIMKWDQLAIIYMGHGTVAIMGGIFLFRGMSNVSVHHVVERALYFFLAFFVLIEEYLFTRKVVENPGFKEMYLEGKGGIEHDFHRLCNHLHMGLDEAISYHSVFCIIVPIATYGIYILGMRNYSR